MAYDHRIKLNVFQESTTYKNDYRPYSPQKREKYKWPNEQTPPPTKPVPEYTEQDVETFYPFKKEHHVPFNLLWTPRPILETDPRRKFPKHLKKETPTGTEEAIKTRPRLYMSPGISLDDIPDKELRDLLVENVYKTNWRKAEEEVIKYLKTTKRGVFDSVLAHGASLEVPIDIHPPLPENWRHLSEKWDKQQKRALVDPTKQFWLKQELKPREEGNPLAKLIPPEMNKEIAELIEDEKLRQPHDKVKPGYVGYQPKLSRGVALAKNDFPVPHPSLSVAQAIATRWKDEY